MRASTCQTNSRCSGAGVLPQAWMQQGQQGAMVSLVPSPSSLTPATTTCVSCLSHMPCCMASSLLLWGMSCAQCPRLRGGQRSQTSLSAGQGGCTSGAWRSVPRSHQTTGVSTSAWRSTGAALTFGGSSRSRFKYHSSPVCACVCVCMSMSMSAPQRVCVCRYRLVLIVHITC